MPLVPFDVRVHGVPIDQARVRGAVNPGITSSASFAEWEAAVAAGLDLWAWESGDYPPLFKARVVAWYQAHRLVQLHTEAAMAQAAERQQRRRKGRG